MTLATFWTRKHRAQSELVPPKKTATIFDAVDAELDEFAVIVGLERQWKTRPNPFAMAEREDNEVFRLRAVAQLAHIIELALKFIDNSGATAMTLQERSASSMTMMSTMTGISPDANEPYVLYLRRLRLEIETWRQRAAARLRMAMSK